MGSVHLNGMAFANTRSFVDGPVDNATGVPYFLISTLDTSTEDLLKNDTCTRLSLTGRIEGVKDMEEKIFAEKALVSRHPIMEQWLQLGGFHVVKLNIEHIWLIDMF